MRPRTYWLLVLALLAALAGQCAGTDTSPPRQPATSVITVTADACDQGATP